MELEPVGPLVPSDIDAVRQSRECDSRRNTADLARAIATRGSNTAAPTLEHLLTAGRVEHRQLPLAIGAHVDPAGVEMEQPRQAVVQPRRGGSGNQALFQRRDAAA